MEGVGRFFLIMNHTRLLHWSEGWRIKMWVKMGRIWNLQKWKIIKWWLPAVFFFLFYITVHRQKAKLLNIICSAAEFCLILLPAWAHNNGPIRTMQPVLLHKPEGEKKKYNNNVVLGKTQTPLVLLKYEPQEEKQRFNWGFYWFTGLLTLSICRDAVDVIWVEITFGSRCATRNCWVACKKCTAEEQLAAAAV